MTRVLEQCVACLQPAGRFCFTTLVEGSMSELGDAWRGVDGDVHVNRFLSESALAASCHGSGFIVENWQLVDCVEQFDSLRELLNSIKGIGAHNMNSGRPRGLMGKSKYAKFVQAYEQQRNSADKLPLTYRVLYAELAVAGT